MKETRYENVLNEEVNNFLLIPIEELKQLESYGMVNKDGIKIGWWKYNLIDDRIHFIFKTSRRIYLFFHKHFLDGFEIKSDTIRRLTVFELGDYD